MTRLRLIVLLAGGLALLTGLTLWVRSGREPVLTQQQGAQMVPPPGAPAKLVGTSAIGHGGPSLPPSGPTNARSAPSPTP